MICFLSLHCDVPPYSTFLCLQIQGFRFVPKKTFESKAKDLSRCKDWFQMYCVLPLFFGQKSGDGHEVFRQGVSCLNFIP